MSLGLHLGLGLSRRGAAAPAAPTDPITYHGLFNGVSGGTGIWNFSDINIGSAGERLLILKLANLRVDSQTPRTLSGVTVNGSAATVRGSVSINGGAIDDNSVVSIATIVVSAAVTEIDVVATYSGSHSFGRLALESIETADLASSTPTDTAATATTVLIDVPANGIVTAVSTSINIGALTGWTNLTERTDAVQAAGGDGLGFSTAYDYGLGIETNRSITVAGSAAQEAIAAIALQGA